MAEYLVLLHEDPVRTRNLSPTEMQALIQRYHEWIGGLRAQGLVTVGKKLKDEGGRHLRGDKGKMVVSDGPYAEGKDVISGLFVLTADSYEQAQALLAPGPHLEFGWIELREIDVIP
ncbi:MAG TPA: YciI family protein [Steroidobacter sp.]|uniref:YciI family protein n=1 Tax=Steroidobacter sp. TaxID=1978227 RepID=UPI002EDAB8AD